jgi:spermidine synthase
VGSVAGEIFFWSTFGSIVGSLLTGFFLIPKFGIDQIVISTGIVLFVLGFTPLLFLGKHKKYLRYIPFVLILLFLTVSLPKYQKNEEIVYIKDGVYEKLIVYEDAVSGRPVRFFQQDHSNSGAMFLDTDDPTDLVFDYSKYYVLYKIFTPEVQNALVIGGGAYSIPSALTTELPNATIDVSEIEPSLFELSKKYFRVSNTPNIKNYIEDGRRFLQKADKKYDLIFSDVYYSFYSIPIHFTTQEFFELAKEKLNNEGIFIANLTGNLSANPPSLIMSEIKTFQSVFQNSYFFAVESPELKTAQNIIFIGYKSDKSIDFNSPAITEHINNTISSLKDRIIDTTQLDLNDHQVLTDNYSPVEYLTGQVLK